MKVGEEERRSAFKVSGWKNGKIDNHGAEYMEASNHGRNGSVTARHVQAQCGEYHFSRNVPFILHFLDPLRPVVSTFVLHVDY